MLTSDTTVTRLLERIPLAIVVTPGYLDGKQRPVHPSDLAGYEFVAMHASIRKPQLTFRLDGGEQITVPLKADVTSNNAVFNRELVLQGLGLGVVPAALVRTLMRQYRAELVRAQQPDRLGGDDDPSASARQAVRGGPIVFDDGGVDDLVRPAAQPEGGGVFAGCAAGREVRG